MEDRGLIGMLTAAFIILLVLTVAAPYLRYNRNPNVKNHLFFGGWDRTYYVHVPLAYNGSHPVPLVIMLHGARGSGLAAEMQTGWSDLAESNDFIVAYPDGGTWWNVFDLGGPSTLPFGFGAGPEPISRDDAGFLLAMIDELKSDYAIDASRVYMTGYSIGASMTITFAFKFTDVLAAIAPVSSAWMTNDSMYNIDPYSVPQPKAPIPVYLWRGDQESWPSLEEDQSQMHYWIALNHASNTSTTVVSGSYKTEIYVDGDAEVRHTEIAGRGHATSYDHTTAQMIWFDFFVRFSREAGQINEQPPSAQG